MADIRPFAAIRPRADLGEEIAALPYDVYNRQEACEVVKNNPGSFLAIDRAETSFPDSVSTYAPEVYEKAASLFHEWLESGRFVREESPCFYLYELTMEGRTQTGIVGTASIEDYKTGVIKKHENTRAEKEEDRVRHITALGAQTGPIFLAYRKDEELDRIVRAAKEAEPLYDFTSEDGIRHRVFRIPEPDRIETIRSRFSSIGRIYIADGHHRAASAVRVGGNGYFLSVLFPSEELAILDYNRVVKDLCGRTPEEFLTEVRNRFLVGEPKTEPVRPSRKGSFSMYLDGLWYPVSFRSEDLSTDPVDGLDVSLLQNLLLDPVLQIKDPRTDHRIDFVGGIRGPKELERRCHTDAAVAFLLYPTSMDELMDVADAGLLMPPKSTWFEPKLRSGLFIHEIA